MFNFEQVFVKSLDHQQVVLGLKDSLSETGYLFHSIQLPKHQRAKQPRLKKWRHFLVSKSVEGWVGIFEDLKLMDKELSADLSTRLNTISVWFSYSEAVEELEYIAYEHGKEIERNELKSESNETRRVVVTSGVRARTKSEEMLYDSAVEFYTRFKLPLRFYSYERIEEMGNHSEYFIHLNFESTEKRERVV